MGEVTPSRGDYIRMEVDRRSAERAQETADGLESRVEALEREVARQYRSGPSPESEDQFAERVIGEARTKAGVDVGLANPLQFVPIVVSNAEVEAAAWEAANRIAESDGRPLMDQQHAEAFVRIVVDTINESRRKAQARPTDEVASRGLGIEAALDAWVDP